MIRQSLLTVIMCIRSTLRSPDCAGYVGPRELVCTSRVGPGRIVPPIRGRVRVVSGPWKPSEKRRSFLPNERVFFEILRPFFPVTIRGPSSTVTHDCLEMITTQPSSEVMKVHEP